LASDTASVMQYPHEKARGIDRLALWVSQYSPVGNGLLQLTEVPSHEGHKGTGESQAAGQPQKIEKVMARFVFVSRPIGLFDC
jgi:hypothetical protein